MLMGSKMFLLCVVILLMARISSLSRWRWLCLRSRLKAHPDVIPANGIAPIKAYQSDLAYLETKVDAGADLIITQLFYDTDIFLKFVNYCCQIGITCSIVPGNMPINNYKGFPRMAGFCNAKIPLEIMVALEPIKHNEEDVRNYGIHSVLKCARRFWLVGSRHCIFIH